MNRRTGSRRQSPGIGAASKLYGIGAIDSNTYLETSNPSGTPGSAAGFYVAVIARPKVLAAANYWASCLTAAAGWGFIQPATSTMSFRAAAGDGSIIHSPTYSLAGLTNAIVPLVGVHDGTALRLYAARAQVGTGTAITGYSTISNRMRIGAGGASNSYLDWFGCIYGVGVPSLANIQQWFDDCVAQRRIADMPGTPASRIWRPIEDGSAPVDSVGSVAMTLSGTGHTTLSLTAPMWGW